MQWHGFCATATPPPNKANLKTAAATAAVTNFIEASPARVLKWFATNANAVQAEADRHCKQYGKLARVTEMRTDAGGRAFAPVVEHLAHLLVARARPHLPAEAWRHRWADGARSA
jgi:hypothetical protein